jgi:hypothetical protein
MLLKRLDNEIQKKVECENEDLVELNINIVNEKLLFVLQCELWNVEYK